MVKKEIKKSKKRLDELLLERGIATSMKESQSLILSGQILVEDQKTSHVGSRFSETAVIRCLKKKRAYVSRSGEKLSGALSHFSIPVKNRVALDIGISTGGFTDCLLQQGAKHVFGVDVSYGLTDYSLQDNDQVTLIERQNARTLSLEDLEKALLKASQPMALAKEISLIVMDLSFISILKVLPQLRLFLPKDTEYLCLVKPQFESKKEEVPKGGIIQDTELREAIISRVITAVDSLGYENLGRCPSTLAGTKGNLEEFIWLRCR